MIFAKNLSVEEVIERLHKGEVLKNTVIGSETKLVNGLLCTYYVDGGCLIGSGVYFEKEDEYYFEEDTFEIKEVGLYKTRDGRKAVISNVDECAVGVIEETGIMTHWDLSGQWISGCTNKRDIVSKWEN